MKEWLLKEEEKAKVGRPKLATQKLLKKTYIMLTASLLTIMVLTVCFIISTFHISALQMLNYVFSDKLSGVVSNNNGFIVKEYYDEDSNYIIKLNASSQVKSYSGVYKCTLYYLKNSKWTVYKSKKYDKGTNFIKIRVDSLKNQNRTWKIKIQVLDSSGVTESYAPYGWTYVDAKEDKNKYAYKVFTVKGYYSPITLAEEKEAKKSKDKIVIETKKDDPRKFIINVPKYSYDLLAYYIDTEGKKTNIINKESLNGEYKLDVLNDSRVIKVTINIYVKDISDSDLKKLILSNWEIKTDEKEKKDYVTNTYLLMPEKAYKR